MSFILRTNIENVYHRVLEYVLRSVNIFHLTINIIPHFRHCPLITKATLVDIMYFLLHIELKRSVCCAVHILCKSLLMDVYLTTTPRSLLCKVYIHSIYLQSYDNIYVNKQNYIIYYVKMFVLYGFFFRMFTGKFIQFTRLSRHNKPKTKCSIWVYNYT